MGSVSEVSHPTCPLAANHSIDAAPPRHQEENLRAALVLEQAAHCLLRTAPPHVRKYAFHMVLSGLRYNACGQQQLGIRAYRCGPQPVRWFLGGPCRTALLCIILN